jgi:hypothetical protein
MGRDAFSDVVRESQEVVDVDFVPTDSYDRADAATAYGQARQATAALEKTLAHTA